MPDEKGDVESKPDEEAFVELKDNEARVNRSKTGSVSWPILAKLALFTFLWRIPGLVIVSGLKSLSGYRGCTKDKPCIYFGFMSRKLQPSTVQHGLEFAIVSSEGGFTYPPRYNASGAAEDFERSMHIRSHMAWFQADQNHTLPEKDIEEICGSHEVEARIHMDLKKQFSMIALIAVMLIDAVLHFAHDTVLLQSTYKTYIEKDMLASRIGVASSLAFGLTCCFALLWGIGFTETFVSVVRKNSQYAAINFSKPTDYNLCYYDLGTATVATALAGVFGIFVKFLLSFPVRLRAILFGDYLFGFSYEVPYRVIMANVGTDMQGNLMQNAGASLLMPVVIADACPEQIWRNEREQRCMLEEQPGRPGRFKTFKVAASLLLPFIIGAFCYWNFVHYKFMVKWWRCWTCIVFGGVAAGLVVTCPWGLEKRTYYYPLRAKLLLFFVMSTSMVFALLAHPMFLQASNIIFDHHHPERSRNVLARTKYIEAFADNASLQLIMLLLGFQMYAYRDFNHYCTRHICGENQVEEELAKEKAANENKDIFRRISTLIGLETEGKTEGSTKS